MSITTTKSTTGRRRGMILGGLMITALAGGIFAPSIASASTAGTAAGMTKVESVTQGAVDVKGYNSSAFRVRNSSPFTLRQISASTGFHWQYGQTPPGDGSTIQPGDEVHYEATTPSGVGNTTSAINYYVVDGNARVVGSASGRLEVSSITGKAAMSCQSVTGPITCLSNGWDTITVTAMNRTQIDTQ